MKGARTWWLALLGVALAACSSRAELPSPVLPLTPTPDAEFRARAPQLEPPPALRAPDIHVHTLDNGMTVLVVERPERPLLSLGYANRAAHDDDVPGRAGLALFTARALNAGTRLENGEVLYKLRIGGITPGLWASWAGSSVGVTTLASAAPQAVWLLARLVQHPIFDPALVEALRVDRSEEIFSSSLSIMNQLRWSALEVLYGSDHPLAVSRRMAAANLRRFSADMVRDFHAQHYGPRDSALIAVGAVRAADVVELARRHFGAWSPAQQGPARPAPSAPALVPGAGRDLRIEGIEGDEAQARIVVALPCPGSSDPDGLAFDVIAVLLGGLTLSRPVVALRHDTGVSYTLDASCVQRPTSGDFFIQTSVEPGRARDALTTILDEVRRLTRAPVSREALESAKRRYLGLVATDLTSTPWLASRLTQNYLHALPLDDLATLEARVHAVSPEQIQRVAARYFAAQIGVAVYGAPRLLHHQLRDLGEVRWSVLKETRR